MEKIKTDSRKVSNGDTFIAIRNVERDGHDYINDAISNGAAKIIAEEGSYQVPTLIVPDTRTYLNEYLNTYIYPLIKDMKLIGVTGTNGKTTTCYLMYQMLNLLNIPSAYIGTIGFYCKDIKKTLNNTTPDIDLLYDMLLCAKEKDAKVVVMEVSSHALSLNRIYGLLFDAVAFTNLTQDHLDYHKTLKNYCNEKKKLMDLTRDKKIAVINGDDPYFKNFINKDNHNIILGKKGKDIKINNIKLSHLDTEIDFKYKDRNINTTINLVGTYNVYNYLTALSLLNEIGIPTDDLLELSSLISPPPGRMEQTVINGNSIFVDYAHTPDAILNVLSSAKEYKSGRIITIIGCGGNRDRTKRPIMASISEENSDYVIFTNDNPRCEDEKVIMEDILSGVKMDNHEVIYNREEAIKRGIELLDKDDILFILGKGHEDYQIIGKEKHHFSDMEMVLKYTRKDD